MPDNPFAGAGYLLRGFALMLRPRVRRFVIAPLALNSALFAAAIYYGAAEFSALLDRLLPGWLEWLEWLLWPLFVVVAALVVFYGFSIVGNLVCAPLNGFLAEAVERELTGRAPDEGRLAWREIAREGGRALGAELRKLGYALRWATPLAVLSFVPVLQLAAPPLWLLFSAWMLCLQYADYPMGNHGLDFAAQRRLLARCRLTSLGFGAAASVVLVVPLLNFMVIPASVAGATALWVERLAPLAARER